MSRLSRLEPTDRVIRFTAAASRALVPDVHAEKKLVVEAEFTDAAMTFTLPAATGSGDKYEIVINAVLTQSFVVAAKGADEMQGVAFVGTGNSGATLATIVNVFVASATSDKYTFNVTTTGGKGGDFIEAVDLKKGFWLVRVFANAVGANAAVATGFAAT
jgi:hypothetical protein